MKKYVIFCFLMTMVVFAQERTIIRPDFKNIRSKIEDKNAEFYYSKLMDRYQNRDTTLTEEAIRHLYFGYLLKSDYNPFAKSDNKQIKAWYEQDQLSAEEIKNAIPVIKAELKKFPFHLSYLSFLGYLQEQNGEQDEAKKTYYFYDHFLDAILQSGDGTTCETGFVVNDISHEYYILHVLKLEQVSQALIGNCDYQELVKDKYKIPGIYFSIDEILKAEMRALGGK